MTAQTLIKEVERAPGGPIVRQAIAEAKARAGRTDPQQLWSMMTPEIRSRLLYGSRYGHFPGDAGLKAS
jgi:hypothetical protein